MIFPNTTRCRIQSTPTVGYPFKRVVSGDNADAHIDLAHGTTNPGLSASMCWVIGLNGLLASYRGSSVVGKITFNVRAYDSVGAFTEIFSLDFAAAGPAPLPFSVPIKFDPGQDVRITMHAGGSGVFGTLNLSNYWREGVLDPVM